MHATLHRNRSDHPLPAVFLDRDGTVNVEKEYLYRVADWEWVPGAPEAIAMLNQAGFVVAVVSNQAGIARGFYDENDVTLLHRHVLQELNQFGGRIDAFFYCPHHPQYKEPRTCTCRKPAPGMLLEATRALNIDLARSWMVGDKLIDVEAGIAAGARSILVQTGYGRSELPRLAPDQMTAADLRAAAEMILNAAE